MRLTLRTLLAYLDDRLSPANAREIGQKITNSPFATELVDRIREVKRKRRLASPAKPQSMIDANLVAEYLDDQLTPELVARVEREVLASDAMLAEVAAAHEILGLIQEPVKVEPRLLSRLYGLDPTGNTDVVRALGGEIAPTRSPGKETPPWRPMASQVTTSRRFAGMIVALLALVWLGVIATDSKLLGTRPTVVTENANKEAVDRLNVAGGELNAADTGVPVPGQGDLVQADRPNLQGEQVVSSSGEPQQLPGNASAIPSATGQSATPIQPTVPEGDLVALVPGTKTPETSPAASALHAADTGKDKPRVLDTDKTADVEAPAVFYLQADSRSVLVLDDTMQRWTALSKIPGGEAIEPSLNRVNCSPLLGKMWFGLPQPFRASVATDSAGWSSTLLGSAVARFHRSEPGGLELLSGRIRLAVDRTVAWNDERPVSFVLGTGSLNSLIVLQTPDSRAAIEVKPLAVLTNSGRVPNQNELPDSCLPLDADLEVQVTVVEGSIGLKTASSDAEHVLKKGQRATWSVLEMSEFSSFVIDSGAPIAAAPAWLFETDAQEIPEQTVLKNRLLDAMATGNEPGVSVLPLLSDRNPQLGVLAVQVLSLTRDTERLLSILFEPRDEAIHRAAIDGLSAIANGSLAGRSTIRKGLETRLPMSEIDTTAQLIQGITDAQAAEPLIVADLLSLLSSDRLATRTLAIYRMEQITRDRMGYHPEAESVRRREAIRRWQKFLDRNSGKLIP
jgi:hypothetical protein